MLSNFIGTLLVAPLVIAWSQFRVRRSGGMTMPVFAAGAVACALFLVSMRDPVRRTGGDRASAGSVGRALTYVPIVFMALVALLWGTRGATLAAFAGALIAMVNTAQGEGPFAGVEGFLGDPELEVEGYALAIALTGLLIAVLAAAQRNAVRAAREWQTRFEAAIGAHRLLAYEWDPASGRMVGHRRRGRAGRRAGRERIATLADWLALVAADDRERVADALRRARARPGRGRHADVSRARRRRQRRWPRPTRRARSATTTASCIASSASCASRTARHAATPA